MKATTQKKESDLVVLQGQTEDRKGFKILRASADKIETGELRPLEEGKPLYGEVVELEQHKEAPFLFDVKAKAGASASTEAKLNADDVPQASETSSPGLSTLLAKELTKKWQEQNVQQAQSAKPAKVTSRAYRNNWDQIWASKKEKKPGLN